jgi:hypothetical protein
MRTADSHNPRHMWPSSLPEPPTPHVATATGDIHAPHDHRMGLSSCTLGEPPLSRAPLVARAFGVVIVARSSRNRRYRAKGASSLVSASGNVRVGLTMGCKFCTIRFKDQVGLGSGFISSHFWTIIYLGPWHFVKNHMDHNPLPPLCEGPPSLMCRDGGIKKWTIAA